MSAGVVVGGRGGHAGAVGGEVGILWVEAADAHGAGIDFHVVQRESGHRFHELADVAHREFAVVVGGDDVDRVGGGAALHECLGLAAAGGGDLEFVEVHDLAAGGGRCEGRILQLDVLRHRLAGGDGDRGLGRLQARVGDRQNRRTVGRPRAVYAAVLAERDECRALDAHLGIADILTGGAVKHTAGDGAG